MNFVIFGTEMNELADLISFLQRGKRMERPELMPRAIGNVMEDCWKHNQEERTTFALLEHILGKMVDPIIRQRFAGAEVMEETNNYMQMNKEIVPNKPETSEPISGYVKMTITENRQVVSLLNATTSPQHSNVPLKLNPQLSMTNYINSSTEINTPPESPLSYKNLRKHMSLSFKKSLVEASTEGYLDVIPATHVWKFIRITHSRNYVRRVTTIATWSRFLV